MLTFEYTGAKGIMTVPEIITTGMRGKQIRLEFSPEWEGLAKTVIFSNGEKTRDVAFGGNPVTIPAEILEQPLKELTVGVYGLGSGGELAIPTVRALGPLILPGALPSGEAAAEPMIPLWEQIQAQLGDPGELDTDTKESLVAAINEMWWRFRNHLAPDKTLTVEGMAADAKAVGDALEAFANDLERYFTDFKGVFMVTASDEQASHNAREILEAAEMGMLPVLYTVSAEHVFFAPLTRFREEKALFEVPGIQDGTATLMRFAVDGEKQVTVTIDAHMNSGSGQGSTGIIGAVGDGVADDTLAFRAALAGNRTVTVPGGTYKLSGELVVRDNCCLELAQDAVLNFTQTQGNCITLNRSASMKGNHATVNVPYGFTGHVINVDTAVHTDVKDVPPWIHWSPQWKTARYLTDLNICMANSSGLHLSADGRSYGTAVYISANRQGTGTVKSNFIWGLNFSGLRIAGAFEYGIRAYNYDGNTYNHEMRIEALVDACKVGVSLEDCSNTYICATVQPRATAGGAVYAAQGIRLVNCRDTDLTGSRIWDWGTETTLWTDDKSNIHQHIAMYGDCRGTILSDHNYYNIPDGFADLRELIYTDTPANFDSLVILQEPVTKWFRPKENLPYFNNGQTEQRLCLYEDLQGLGGEKPWKHIRTVVLGEQVQLVSVTTDEAGNPFEFDEIFIRSFTMQGTEKMGKGCAIWVNDAALPAHTTNNSVYFDFTARHHDGWYSPTTVHLYPVCGQFHLQSVYHDSGVTSEAYLNGGYTTVDEVYQNVNSVYYRGTSAGGHVDTLTNSPEKSAKITAFSYGAAYSDHTFAVGSIFEFYGR